MSKKQSRISEEDKIQHEALYEEFHKIDDLLETHANIMIVLVSALLAFLFTLKSIAAVDAVCVVGFFVSLEFFLHTFRFKHIAIDAKERLKVIEARMGIDTLRRDTHLLGKKALKVPTGSTLICCIGAMFMTLWLILIVSFNVGIIHLPV